MTWRQIETSREIRQWARILIPGGIALVAILSDEERRQQLKSLFKRSSQKNQSL